MDTRNATRTGAAVVAVLLTLWLTALTVHAREGAAWERADCALIHAAPWESATVIGRVEDGASLTILEQDGDFYKIDCYDMVGYIAKAQVSWQAPDSATACCVDGSEETASTLYVPLSDAADLRQLIVDTAAAQLGVPYVMGGTSPAGFDCSGFVQYVLGHCGISMPRTVSQQLRETVVISRDCLEPGDLVFFSDGSSFSSHVGIYAGDGQILHAGNAGIGYGDLDNAYFTRTYLCARRVVNISDPALSALPCAAVMGILSAGRTAI